jgi:hypothetical protein
MIISIEIFDKKLKEATTLLGIRKSTKDKKVKENVIQNINSALKSIGRSRKKSDLDARREIQMAVVSSSTKENHLVKSMEKALGTSRKTLHKHRKFRLQIDVNDELACWTVICRQPYKDRLGEDVKKIIYEYWMKNSRVSPKARDVMRRRITRNQYEEHAKHILDTTQIELFNKFIEENHGINVSISTFVQQKPWYVKPITVRDTCCCHYHVEFQLYYDTFLNFGKTFWKNSPPPSTIHDFISQILCGRENHELFYQKKCVGGKKCDHCGNLTLFHNKYSIDINDQSLSNIKVKWKRYEYIHTSISSNNSTSAKRIDLQEEEIFVIEFLKKFETKIYKYTKHSHRARWQDLQFKKSHEIFPPGTILSIVDFAENYTFVAQNEIQSEYYHSDQVSMLVHILYRHAEQNVDHIESTSGIDMLLKNITFISAMIVHMIHILYNIVLIRFMTH